MTGAPQASWRRSLVRSLGRVLISVVALVCGLLLIFQHRLIYIPHAYPATLTLTPDIERIEFTTSEGAQVCYWIRPQPGHDRVWLAFAGNASLALAWRNVVRPAEGMLLIEYPGYGASAGSASPSSILATTEAAVAELVRREPTSMAHPAVVGHSLGCAAALQYAARHPVERIVLVAPFRRMLDMAERVVGWPLCELLLHRFDNEARLREILAAGTPPQIDLWHGTEDEVIPFAMGQGLAAEFPAIHFHPVVGADHNGILADVTTLGFMRD